MQEDCMYFELPPFYEQLGEQGVKFYVRNKEVKPKKAAKKVEEGKSLYMADYVLDDRGKITEVHIDPVKK